MTTLAWIIVLIFVAIVFYMTGSCVELYQEKTRQPHIKPKWYKGSQNEWFMNRTISSWGVNDLELRNANLKNEISHLKSVNEKISKANSETMAYASHIKEDNEALKDHISTLKKVLTQYETQPSFRSTSGGNYNPDWLKSLNVMKIEADIKRDHDAMIEDHEERLTKIEAVMPPIIETESKVRKCYVADWSKVVPISVSMKKPPIGKTPNGVENVNP